MSLRLVSRPTSSVPSKRWSAEALRLGFVAVTDCAPLLIAQSHGLFAKYGLDVTLSRQLGWATVRDKLFTGELHGSHAVAGLSLSMSMGLDGHQCDVFTPFVINLHGDAITLSADLWRKGVRDGETLRKLIRSTPQRLLTFAAVSRHSYHLFLLRRWLQSSGIDPDRSVRIVVLPPTQLVANLAEGLIDGCCVGEPWTSEAVARQCGWCVATSDQIMLGHTEKVLLLRQHHFEKHPEVVTALVRSLDEACAFCDHPQNRAEVARTLHHSGHFKASLEVLSQSLCGPFDLGTGKRRSANGLHIFHQDGANRPSAERATALVAEFSTHGLFTPQQANTAKSRLPSIWREDLYSQAMHSISPVTKPAASHIQLI